MKVGLFRPITLWPFPKKQLARLAERAGRFLVVEMSMGQFVDDVRLAVGGRIEVDLYARPAGIPSGEEVFAAVEKSHKSLSSSGPAAKPAKPKGKPGRPRKKPARKVGRPAKKGRKGGRR
jgi:pyruvate/2-oxoacid:ferredoxin oxidoreductase alpha subunit